MMERLNQLSQRERLLLLGLSGLLIVLLLIYLVILPVLRFEGTAKSRYSEAVRLEALAQDIEAPDARPSEDRGLRSVVTSYADRNAVPYTRVTQTPSGDVQIDLGDTSHRAVFSWLRALEDSEGVVVTAAYLAPGESAGAVSGRFTLQRSAR